MQNRTGYVGDYTCNVISNAFINTAAGNRPRMSYLAEQIT